MPGVGHSVECLLDPGLDGAVRAEWDALADAGLRPRERPPWRRAASGEPVHEGPVHEGPVHEESMPARRPHITLTWATAYGEDGERDLPGLVLAGAGLPVAIRLGGLVVFGRRPRFVLARAVVPSKDLLDLHERVATRLRDSPGFSATARPAAWTPHVTLARLRSAEQLAAAIELLSAGPGARAGSVVAVRRWDGYNRREWLVAGAAPHPPR